MIRLHRFGLEFMDLPPYPFFFSFSILMLELVAQGKYLIPSIEYRFIFFPVNFHVYCALYYSIYYMI